MKTTLKVLAVALIAGGAMFAQPRVSIGIGVGGYGPGYFPPPAYAQVAPPCPGPDYTWVAGYWAPQGGRNVWINGFWRVPSRFNSYRSYERDRDHGHDNRYDNRYDNRARAYSNSFRR